MVLPGLKSSSFLSLGQLCDDNCNILLTKHHLHTIKNGKEILRGYRNYQDGLWDVPLSTATKPSATGITTTKQHKVQHTSAIQLSATGTISTRQHKVPTTTAP